MKRFTMAALVAATLGFGLPAASLFAKDAIKADAPSSEVKTVTGKSGCATCEGVTSSGHAILLTDKAGVRWVLIGSGPAYDAAHEVRKDSKTITATLAGDPVEKKDENGKVYKEVKISDIKVDA